MPQIKDLAKKAGVESGVVVGAGALVALLVTFIIFGSTILTLTITVLYPSVKSIKAIESTGDTDDKEWLTYWIIFGLFTLIDDFTCCFLGLIPYYYWIRLAFFVYLLAPQTQGALFLYNKVVKDLLSKNKDAINSLIADVKGSATEAVSQAKKTAISELSNPANLARAAELTQKAKEELNKAE